MQGAILVALSGAARRDRRSRPASSAAKTRASSSSAARPLRILLAEDNPVNQRVALYLLGTAGHTAAAVTNGVEVLRTLKTERFDLVLMDVQMPEMDGFEATRAIRLEEEETGRHIPIVAMTAHAMKGDRERCLDAGMDAYVAKPINKDELLRVLQEVVAADGEAALELAQGGKTA